MARSLIKINTTSPGLDQLWRGKKSSVMAQCGVLGIIFLLLYATVLSGLISDWYSYSIYSYGFLVPVISCYLIWRKASDLHGVPVVSTLWGSVLLLTAVALYLLGEAATDTFVMRISMVLAVAALTQTVFGSCYLKTLAFPVSYLFFMIPFPYLLVKELTNHLMFFHAAQSATVLQFLGIPIFLESNFLHLPNITLEVADVCSGISSILALLVLGVAYAYFLPVSRIARAFLVVSAVPLAVLANLVRIITTVVLTYYYGPVVLKSFFHAFHGVFNFLLAIVLLVLMGELFRKTLPGIPGRPKTDRQLAIGSRNRRPSWAPTITGAAILVFGGYIGLALQNSTGPTRTLGLETLPASVGTYHVTPLAWSDEYKDPKAQEALTRIYSTTSGIPIEVFVGYRGNGGGRDHLQSPKLILPVKWNYIWVKPAILEINQAEKLEVNWMLTQRNDTRRVVLYWYESGGQAFSGELQYRLALLKDRILNARSGVAVIRIATPIMSGETVEEAQQRLKTLVIQVYPDLSKILRR